MFGTIKKGYFNDGQQAEHDILFVLSYVRIYVRSFVRTCSYIVDECAVYRFPWISIGQFLSEYCQPMLYGHRTNHQHILYCVLQIVSPHSIHIHRRRRPNQQQKKAVAVVRCRFYRCANLLFFFLLKMELPTIRRTNSTFESHP